MWRKQSAPSACVFQIFPRHSLCMKKVEILMPPPHFTVLYFFRHDSVLVEHPPSETLRLRKGTQKHAAKTAAKINTNLMRCVYWYNSLPSNKVTYSIWGCWQLFWWRNIQYFSKMVNQETPQILIYVLFIFTYLSNREKRAYIWAYIWDRLLLCWSTKDVTSCTFSSASSPCLPLLS